MSRFISWFATRNGRRFTRACVGVTGLSIFGFHIAIHGPLQEETKNLFQIYKNEKPKPLSSSVKLLVKEVLADTQLQPEDKKKIKFFNVIGHDLYHSGGISSPWGARIGIPFYFESKGDINFNELRILGHDSIDWIIDGQDLILALTLSEKAKKFAIMQEIYSCDIWNILDNAFTSSGCFLMASILISRINAKRDALSKIPLKKRLLLYALFYSMSLILYRCLRDPTKHISDKKCDTQAASMGIEYLEGGIEFYEKTLQKNKALRELLGSRGKQLYDKDGNDNYIIFAPKLPVRKRLEHLQDLKKELQTVAV